jgi:tetratricopeptide (TPR) repeat protein
LVELNSTNNTAWFNLAGALQALGNWEEAGARFEKSRAVDPNRFEAHLGLGSSRVYIRAERPALEAYERSCA